MSNSSSVNTSLSIPFRINLLAKESGLITFTTLVSSCRLAWSDKLERYGEFIV